MIETVTAKVRDIVYKDSSITRFIVEIEDIPHNCINYNYITGEVKKDDIVILNTTAAKLELGSGGCHFVISNLCREQYSNLGEGHIMKLRYTPMQINVMAAEAQESPHHDVFNSFSSLGNMPVIVGTLHSMVAPAVLALKKLAGKERIAYIMTDGGALPIYMSEAVRYLACKGLINGTVTYGNAFGGDVECINVYTALIAAKEILKADAAVVCMGPGIAGTDTVYGFSGIEQSQIIDSVNNLKGKAIAVPRISFSDSRERHFGISHHSRTTLGKLCCTKAAIALPLLEKSKLEILNSQLHESGISEKHEVSFWNIEETEHIFQASEYCFNKMGKSYNQDREYFLTCGVAACLAAN